MFHYYTNIISSTLGIDDAISFESDYTTYSDERPESNFYGANYDSSTPDVIFIESGLETLPSERKESPRIKSESIIKSEHITSITPQPHIACQSNLTISDLVKSRSRGAKNKAQAVITNLISDDRDIVVKSERKFNRRRVNAKPIRSKFPLRGVKVKRDYVDAELACLGKDATHLRKHCEYLYNYFDSYHVDEELPIDMYISKVLDTIVTFANFKMMVNLSTGKLTVDLLCHTPYIEVSCRCGKFRKYMSELIG